MSTTEQNKVDINYNVLRFIYIEAMKDATRWNAFEGERNWLWSDKKVYKPLIKELGAFLDIVLSGKYKDENMQNKYDKAFIDLCSNVRSKVNKLSFGNTQKLVNIFIKYFYVLSYNHNGIDASYFRCCHCPMDQVLLADIWKKCKTELRNREWCYNDFTAAWGNPKFDEDKDKNNEMILKRYNDFQDMVRAQCKNYQPQTCERPLYPIEYDYYIWGNDDKQ